MGPGRRPVRPLVGRRHDVLASLGDGGSFRADRQRGPHRGGDNARAAARVGLAGSEPRGRPRCGQGPRVRARAQVARCCDDAGSCAVGVSRSARRSDLHGAAAHGPADHRESDVGLGGGRPRLARDADHKRAGCGLSLPRVPVSGAGSSRGAPPPPQPDLPWRRWRGGRRCDRRWCGPLVKREQSPGVIGGGGDYHRPREARTISPESRLEPAGIITRAANGSQTERRARYRSDRPTEGDCSVVRDHEAHTKVPRPAACAFDSDARKDGKARL